MQRVSGENIFGMMFGLRSPFASCRWFVRRVDRPTPTRTTSLSHRSLKSSGLVFLGERASAMLAFASRGCLALLHSWTRGCQRLRFFNASTVSGHLGELPTNLDALPAGSWCPCTRCRLSGFVSEWTCSPHSQGSRFPRSQRML